MGPLELLKYYVTGAIERGKKIAITSIPKCKVCGEPCYSDTYETVCSRQCLKELTKPKPSERERENYE